MPATRPVSLEDLARYPRMTGWFSPPLLVRLLGRVLVSGLFGHYADRRLVIAALDTPAKEELLRRARAFLPDGAARKPGQIDPDGEGAIWIDYLADLGDGFDATYAIASLLAQERLAVGGVETRRGQLLLMGGDEVYPHAAAEHYQRRLLDPYGWAFPDPDPASADGPPLFAIPGNHDWYDGLAQFLTVFAREGGRHIGGWRTAQRRSYFALQIAPDWWVWGLDAQLADFIDQPQRDYFAMMAKEMAPGSNLILLGPEPGWLFTGEKGARSLGVLDEAARLAVACCKDVAIRLVIAGDQHHYSRYQSDDGGTQFITSGGGGAYLHATHALPERVTFDAAGGPSWLDGRIEGLRLAREPGAGTEALYPSRADSRRALRGVFWFALLNPGFATLLGVVYALFGAIALRASIYDLWIVPAAMFAGFWVYSRQQEGGGPMVVAVSLAAALAHAAAAIGLAHALAALHPLLPAALQGPRASFLVYAAAMTALGGGVAATLLASGLFGFSRWFDIDHNDAFSAIRRDTHRHFLRIRIRGDEVTLFPIGLDRPPRRRDWRVNADGAGRPAPAYVPDPPLAPHLIEGPVRLGPALDGRARSA
ncbi:MAG: metallophosphoesterase [Methylobacteriaceae bacterium]|nr:metallophosphoesterase [Methylobacteriaceae bacterium]